MGDTEANGETEPTEQQRARTLPVTEAAEEAAEEDEDETTDFGGSIT